MLREAREAPQVVARLLERNAPLCRDLGERLRASPPPFAVTCARGSSDNAATFVKYLLEIHSGLVTASVGPSVTSVYEARPRMRDALFLAVSQSGRSPDILNLAQAGRDDGALTVALVNDTSSPLASTCEVVLPLHAGPEKSVAATKSFIAALAAGFQLVAHWSQDQELLDALDTPARCARQGLSNRLVGSGCRILTEADNLFVVGRGVGFAVAQEAALKLKETSGIHAEAMSAAELMHGPWTLAGDHFPILVLSQQRRDLERRQRSRDEAERAGRSRRRRRSGGRPGERDAALGRGRASLSCADRPDPELLSARERHRAWRRGRNPDNPPRLRKVTETV